MNGDMVLFIGRRTLETAMLISAPVLVATLLTGLLVGMFQAVTSIRDMTLGIVLRLACVGLVLMVCGGWMLRLAIGFTHEVFNQIQTMGH
jgi:flagellar biosynthetic protein FliQ